MYVHVYIFLSLLLLFVSMLCHINIYIYMYVLTYYVDALRLFLLIFLSSGFLHILNSTQTFIPTVWLKVIWLNDFQTSEQNETEGSIMPCSICCFIFVLIICFTFCWPHILTQSDFNITFIRWRHMAANNGGKQLV